jgi:hypothetical protein
VEGVADLDSLAARFAVGSGVAKRDSGELGTEGAPLHGEVRVPIARDARFRRHVTDDSDVT